MSDYARIDGHPGFYRRNGLVYFRFRDRRGRKRWDSARTIKEAERKKIQRELEVERGDHQDGSRDRFQDYAPPGSTPTRAAQRGGISETTRDDYRRRLEQAAIPFLGKMRLSEIEPRDVKEYARKLGPGARSRTPSGSPSPPSGRSSPPQLRKVSSAPTPPPVCDSRSAAPTSTVRRSR
jgi:hypothetical protein